MPSLSTLASFLLAFSSITTSSLTSAQDLSCKNCRGNNRKCVADTTIQVLSDDDCSACVKASSKWTWPCNVEGLCWCWDSTTPKYKPALSSSYEEATDDEPCDLFTKDMFEEIAPNAVHPYTYSGLCDAIDYLNERYDEKIFKMGTREQQRQEWAAFLGHTTHESAQYTASREYLPCGRTIDSAAGTFCKPCSSDNFDWDNMYCEISEVANGKYYEDYCDKIVTPPYGCVCGPTSEVDKDEYKGLINPNFVYFGRGAIQLSWNANYVKASQVLAESSDTLCSQPELVATQPKYAWGTALWFWMFSKPPGMETTSHVQSLEGSFGGSLNIINGGLECPADPQGYHVKAIVTRLRYYCIAASVVGVKRLLDMDGCEGLSEKFEECVMTGYCPECNDFFLDPSPAPSKAPSPAAPTEQPIGFRSWANDSWMGDIKRRDSSGMGVSSVFKVVTFLTVAYFGTQ
mmetsp:Transcript_24354/g.46655  ORF Transcript_24354/g.46655 Transcript_24354/m.46655 type:complete len:459 (-) Transcript_24354:303-1679(-)